MTEEQKNSELVTIEMRRATLLDILSAWRAATRNGRREENRLMPLLYSPILIPANEWPCGDSRVRLSATLPEVLASDYKEVIAAEKQRLLKELYGP